MTIGAVEAAAVGISGAAAVLTGIGVVIPPGIATSGIGIGLGKATVGVSVTILDDWAVVNTTGLFLTGVSSDIGVTLGLTVTLCAGTPGEAVVGVRPTLVVASWLPCESAPRVFVIANAWGDFTPRS